MIKQCFCFFAFFSCSFSLFFSSSTFLPFRLYSITCNEGDMHQQNESNERTCNVIYCHRLSRYTDQTLVVLEWRRQ